MRPTANCWRTWRVSGRERASSGLLRILRSLLVDLLDISPQTAISSTYYRTIINFVKEKVKALPISPFSPGRGWRSRSRGRTGCLRVPSPQCRIPAPCNLPAGNGIAPMNARCEITLQGRFWSDKWYEYSRTWPHCCASCLGYSGVCPDNVSDNARLDEHGSRKAAEAARLARQAFFCLCLGALAAWRGIVRSCIAPDRSQPERPATQAASGQRALYGLSRDQPSHGQAAARHAAWVQ